MSNDLVCSISFFRFNYCFPHDAPLFKFFFHRVNVTAYAEQYRLMYKYGKKIIHNLNIHKDFEFSIS